MSLPGLADDPTGGSLSAIRSFAGLFRDRAREAQHRSSEAAAALPSLEALDSEAAAPLREAVTRLGLRFAEAGTGGNDIAAILDGYASELESLRREAQLRHSQAQADYDAIWARRREALNEVSEFAVGWTLNWDDVIPSWMYFSDQSYLHRWRWAIEEYRRSVARYNGLRHTREALDSRTAARLRAVRLVAEITRGDTIPAGGFGAAVALWASHLGVITAGELAGVTDPDLIRNIWNQLDEDQRNRMIREHPEIIGNLDGIPIRDRVAANRINVENEIAWRKREIERLTIELAAAEERQRTHYDLGPDGRFAELGETGLTPSQYRNQILEHGRIISYYQSLLDQKVTWFDNDDIAHTETGARIVVFDPAKGAIATYHGAIDPHTGDIPSWVEHVAISVPGTNSNMTNFADARGSDFYQSAGRNSAVFQWSGGPFPQSIPEAMDASYSHVLAPRLRDFAAGVAVPEGATLTVVGHSYGAATVGLAEQAGLRADRILYVSAAGMGDGVSGLSDFPHTADVPHYSMMARNDSVVGAIQPDWISMHGQSPLSAEGVTRLETGWIKANDQSSSTLESYNIPDNWSPPMFDSHSSVFTPGSTAYVNIIAVITGGEALLFAEDVQHTYYSEYGPGTFSTSGITNADYRPEYVQVE